MNVDEFLDHGWDEHAAVQAATRIKEMHVTPGQTLRAGVWRELA